MQSCGEMMRTALINGLFSQAQKVDKIAHVYKNANSKMKHPCGIEIIHRLDCILLSKEFVMGLR